MTRDPRKGVKPSVCTNCGKVMDSASEVASDGRPSPGDVAICFYCHHLMAYTNDMTLRDLTDAEVVEVAGDPAIIVAMNALAAFKEWEAKHKR